MLWYPDYVTQIQVIWLAAVSPHSYLIGFCSLPMKSTACDLLSRIANINGWSHVTVGGIHIMAIPIPVAAAASLPSSLISKNALWITCGKREKKHKIISFWRKWWSLKYIIYGYQGWGRTHTHHCYSYPCRNCRLADFFIYFQKSLAVEALCYLFWTSDPA